MAENKIRILDEQTINQIKAGEVIENASSVVKELVDNAIDANATKIVIEAQGSGRDWIVVQDNGIGMSKDDVLLCLEKHATSKIQSQEDLWKISSMGFRGEALAAISSISHVSILTAPSHNGRAGLLDGTSLSASGGNITACQPTMTLGGTKVRVESLFYNVPARRKFLKSPAKEAQDIVKMVTLQALAKPEIGFDLVLNQKKELQVNPEERNARIKRVLGQQFFSSLLELSYSCDWLKIHGFIGKPEASRPNRQGQYLFINGRAVASPFISCVVKDAYGSSIDDARHPIFVLYLEIDQERVDINVHPQKKEVRISYEEELKSHLIAHVSEVLFSLARKNIVPSLDMPVAPFRPIERHFEFPSPPLQVREQTIEPERPPFQLLTVYKDYILITFDADQFSTMPNELQEDGILFIDSKQALSRITHEELESPKGEIASQMLLVPSFFEFTQSEAHAIRGLVPELEKIGISIREFGTNGFLVEAMPRILEEIDLEEFLRQVATSSSVVLDAPLFAKKAGKLSLEVAEQIVKKLFLCRDPWVSPSGIPTMSLMTKHELKKRFSS